jgi:hypothetical protein
MAEQAIILIPDISGFTDFTGATEIDHESCGPRTRCEPSMSAKPCGRIQS